MAGVDIAEREGDDGEATHAMRGAMNGLEQAGTTYLR